MRPSVSVLIVAWNSSVELRRTLPPLLEELGEGDELIVVDNDSPDDSAAVTMMLAPEAKIVTMGRNRGFAGGANVGASAATGDLLVILNPDAMPLPGWGEAIRRPWREGRGWSAWQGLVAGEDGSTINSAGNPCHFTGIVWAGMHDEPIAAAPGPGEVTSLSGACLAVPLEVWRRHGGFAERFFMYHEDVDLSLRLRLAGEMTGIEPTAVVAHDYEFTASSDEQVALARAQPPGDAGPPLARLAAPPPGAGAAGDRGGAPARRRRGRLGGPEAPRRRRSDRLAAAPPARAPRDPARPPDLRRRLRRAP